MNSRNKGKAGELELSKVLKTYGYDTRRGQQYCGANGDADVVGLPHIHIENLTEFYPAFKQVGLKKTGGKGCAIICKDNDYECKSCPLQEALDKLYRLERDEK